MVNRHSDRVRLVRSGRGFEVETLVNLQAHVDEGCAGHIARRWTLARGTRAASTWALTFEADGSCRPVIRVAPDLLYLADLRIRRVQ